MGYVTSFVELRDGEGNVTHEHIRVTEMKNPQYFTGVVWLPRQEDWQEIIEENKIPTLFFFRDFYNKWAQPQICSLSLKEMTTIAWCLFVHKKVYGLSWDWDKSKWVKIK